jgi:transposase
MDAAGQYAANLEHFLRGLDLPITLSIGEPKRNKDYQKAHFPKRTTDDTESQAMARFGVVETPAATPPVPCQMLLLREVAARLQAHVKQTTQASNRLHNLMARVFPELATLVSDFGARWLLRVLDKYPTPERLAQCRLASLEKIPYLPNDQAQALHQAAQCSVGSLRGNVAESLVRDLVAQLQHCQQTEQNMRNLLTTAFADLPGSGHRQLLTIPGIGEATAAVLVAKIVDIDRFQTAAQLVGYFGIFPEENSSGVDQQGQPLPPGTMSMSHKGNDLARGYLWNAARVGMRCNPALRALYARLRAKGKRGDVALGHCMRKLLQLVFAVWKTDRPFDEQHFPWHTASSDAPSAVHEPAVKETAETNEARNEKAAGHKREKPAEKVVTAATASVEPLPRPVNPSPQAKRARPEVDFAFVRGQTTMQQVLSHLGFFETLRGRGQQRRGPCPVHGKPTDRHDTFSVHLGKNICQCFFPECGVHGNVLDLWAAVHGKPLYEAALHLAEVFRLHRNREEERVEGTR